MSAQLHTTDFLPAFDSLIPAFPAHSLTRKKRILSEGGAWLVEHQEAQHRRFHSFLLYDQDYIHHRQQEADEEKGAKILDGYYLLNCAKLDDPQDICSIDISNQGLTDAKEDDFDLFVNLFHVNAAENELKLESLSAFPMVREIQFQFNSLSKTKLTPSNFKHLDTLDLSYNHVSHSAILNVGLLEKLRVLVLTSNEIKNLPSNMAYPAVDGDDNVMKRFSSLEELYLDNNHLCDLSTFSTLGGLNKLKYLNLSKNHIYYIPHLRVLGSAIANVTRENDKSRSLKSDKSNKSLTKGKSRHSSAKSQAVRDKSNAEFGLTKSKLTPQNKSKKSQIDVSSSQEGSQEGDLTTPDGSRHQDTEEEEHGICDDKPLSRETPGLGKHLSRENTGQEQLQHIASSSAFPTGSIKSGMVERDLNKSESPDAINKNKLNVDAYLISEGKSTADQETIYPTAPMPLQQPFPQLQTLILSDNAITEEEGVLACALWPKLCQLVLHNNPVINQCRGLPILLTHELTLRNGITIIRTPPTKVKKPPSVTVTASSRRVKPPPRPLPRQPHPELLALESAPPLYLPPPTGSTTRAQSTETSPKTPEQTPKQQTPKLQQTSDPPKEESGDTIFLTQVEDQEAEVEEELESMRSAASSPDIIAYSVDTLHVPEKYKGFEDLVDVEDDPDDIIPEHIQTAVQSLRRALQKSMILPDIYKDVCKTERLANKHAYKSCKGQRMLPPPEKIDKNKPVKDGLAMIKGQVIAEEGDLNQYINNENRRIRGQGKKLLSQIQERYDKVRSECLHQRSKLLEEIKGNKQSITSTYSLQDIAPLSSILPRTRTQASTYDSDRNSFSNTPYTFKEENDDSMSRESSQYTL